MIIVIIKPQAIYSPYKKYRFVKEFGFNRGSI